MTTKAQDTHLDQIRHSTSHIMAQAVKELYPEVKLGIGPAIKDGFYYDFEREEAFTEEDLAKIEARMREIIEASRPFEHFDWTKKKALEHFTKANEPFKCELIRDIPSDTVSIYQQGSFIDLC